MNINVKVNPAYFAYLNKPQFMQIYFGGSSSGKSYFLCQKVVLDNLHGANWLVCRNVARTIRNSVYNELKKAISTMGVAHLFNINKSDMVITNKLNGKQILFAGLDDPEKIKSITPAVGVLERVFVEEATEVKREAIKQLEKRLRGYSRIKKMIMLAFNPILKSHYLYKEYFGEWIDGKNSYEDDNKLILKTTYKDNLFLTNEDRALLENESDPYFYDVYTLGNWGVLGNIIFKNWRVADLTDEIPHFDNLYHGLDVGYTNPNAFIKVHLDNENKKIYVIDEYYHAGMQDEDLLGVSNIFFGRDYVTVDNAANKTIDYLANHGIAAVPAAKGPDSVNRGIRWLWGYEIIIHKDCQNFKNEIEQYHWQQDKNGNVLEKPVKVNDHLLDALRYALEIEMAGAVVQVGVRI